MTRSPWPLLNASTTNDGAQALHVAVVVPAFDEARLIGRTLRTIPAWVRTVVVVDDASRDETSEQAAAVGDPRVLVVRHAENGGVGKAIVTGYRLAFARGADVCVVMAGDGQMDPADLEALLLPIARGEADYVKGNRLAFDGAFARMPWTRWLGNVGLSMLTRAATGLAIGDSQCGYTALTRDAAEQLPLESLWPRYGYPNDLLGMLAERSLRVADVTVRPVYGDEKSGVGLRHAFFVVPYVLARVLARRVLFALSSSRLSRPRLPEPELPIEP